jgi:hypothetical protein
MDLGDLHPHAEIEIDFGDQPTRIKFTAGIGQSAPQIHSVTQAGQEILTQLSADELKSIAAQIWRNQCSSS